ncbi:hypothetical protein SO802_019086 [Lithocarpus litseifolius]|uniref:Uncharacterized protein n=1 Tax=Lithocarpus litseifolius TaxID=425828 RepID=A0AAW2CPT4_9ROSI
MSRLEDEFQHVLIRNTVPLDAERLYGSIRQSSLSCPVNDVGIIAREDDVSVVVSGFSSGCRFGSGCVGYGFGVLDLTGVGIGVEGRSAWVIS